LLTFIRLQEETARVENFLVDGSFSKAIIECFNNNEASPDAFENFLEPLQRLLRLSPPVASTLAQEEMFVGTAQKLNSKKAVVRLNLLRIIRSICDASEDQGGASLIQVFHLYEAVERLAEFDAAILVREMASDLIKLSDMSLRRPYESGGRGLRPGTRRSSSANTTPPAQHISLPSPIATSTPQHLRSGQAKGFFDNVGNSNGSSRYEAARKVTRRPSTTTLTPSSPYRQGSGDSTSSDRTNSLKSTTASPAVAAWASSSQASSSAKSRLPRTSSSRLTRLNIASPRKEDNMTPTHAPSAARSGSALNPARRRRVTSSGAGAGIPEK
jgi:hypothetical protein